MSAAEAANVVLYMVEWFYATITTIVPSTTKLKKRKKNVDMCLD